MILGGCLRVHCTAIPDDAIHIIPISRLIACWSKIHVPDPIWKYAGRALRSLTDEEKRNYLQAVEEVHRLYKKPQEFSPVPAALQTMWQARQSRSTITGIPWPLHNERLRHNLAFIQDQRPMPTKQSMYTVAGEAMMDAQKSKNHKQLNSHQLKKHTAKE